jgi:hypothetical protein
MDAHVPAPIARALARGGVDVKNAQEDGTTELSDDKLLDRATALHRALVTRDADLLAEAKKRQLSGQFELGCEHPGGQAIPIAPHRESRSARRAAAIVSRVGWNPGGGRSRA